MAHSFKIVFKGRPYDLAEISIKLATELGIHLNRISIGVDTIKKSINSLSVNPFLDDYYGLHFTYRFNDNDMYTDQIFAEDYGFIDEDFRYSQQVLFSYNGFWDKELITESLQPLFRIASCLQEDKYEDSILLYTGPDKMTIINTKINGLISVNSSCFELFGGQLEKMTDDYFTK